MPARRASVESRQPTSNPGVVYPTAWMQREGDLVGGSGKDSAFSVVNPAEKTSLNKEPGAILATALL